MTLMYELLGEKANVSLDLGRGTFGSIFDSGVSLCWKGAGNEDFIFRIMGN